MIIGLLESDYSYQIVAIEMVINLRNSFQRSLAATKSYTVILKWHFVNVLSKKNFAMMCCISC